MPEHPDFYRPILWDNGEESEPYRYSTGATANIIKLCGDFFILTVNHAIDELKKGYPLEACRVPWRIQSEAYCKIGKGVNFSLPADYENKLIADVCIHKLEGPSCPEHSLEPGEYLDLDFLDFTEGHHPRYLSGFPTYAQEPDYEERAMGGIGHTIQGHIETTSDQGIYKFTSEYLKSVEANGYCGGLITCDVFGNVTLEGICIQGGGNTKIDFIFFIGVDVLREHLSMAYQKLISEPTR